MNGLLVTGYASLDYPVSLGGMVQPDQTTHITNRDPDAWPRTGGSPYYVAAASSKLNGRATPITWLGDDDLARKFKEDCAEEAIVTDGIVQFRGQRSPACIMIHQDDGSTSCLFDPAFAGQERLSPQQRYLITNCDLICITVGPGHLIEEILSLVPAKAKLFWVTKKDEHAFPRDICPQLAARASVVFCNKSERIWLDSFDANIPLIVETHGADGCKVITCQGEQMISAKPVEVSDPTGAGDTFAGGFIEAFSRTDDPIVAAEVGVESARELLENRRVEG